MGNTSSAGNSETEEEDPPKDTATSTGIEKELTEYDGNIELTALFDPKTTPSHSRQNQRRWK